MSSMIAPAPHGVRYLIDRAGVSSFAPEGLRWLVADRSLELRSTAASPDDLHTRAAIINCGMALHQMQMVFAAHGARAAVTIGAGEDVFATVTPTGPHAVSADDTAMYEALLGNASPGTARHLGAGELVALLSRKVREYGVAVQVFDDTTAQFLAAVGAAGIRAKTPRNAPRPVSTATVLHLMLITGGDTPADWMRAGQALSAAMLTCAMLDMEAAIGGMAETAGARALLRSLAGSAEQPQLWMEVTTPHSPPAHTYQPCAALSHTGDRSPGSEIGEDTTMDWLKAGEALSAVPLTETAAGLGTVPLSDVTDLAGSRQQLRQLLPGTGTPQLAVRIGHSPPGSPPQTPRRTEGEVISHDFTATMAVTRHRAIPTSEEVQAHGNYDQASATPSRYGPDRAAADRRIRWPPFRCTSRGRGDKCCWGACRIEGQAIRADPCRTNGPRNS